MSSIQITYVLINTPSTSLGLQDLSVTEFQNGSVIAVLSLQYDTIYSVTADDLDQTLTSSASSDLLTDGTDSLDVDSSTIIGKLILYILNVSV